ncbi:MAG: chlorinating enzyme [Candidatus Sulfotelmatobacter sp.]|jgi:non-haem Fe2+, alpha-ketoglutarate-dependent halogenase
MTTTKVESFALTDAEQTFFEENGYVGPFTLYQPEEMEQIWNKTRRQVFDRSHAIYEIDMHSGPNNIANYDRHLDVPFLAQHIARPEIVDKLKAALGPDVLCWRTEFFPKYGGDEGTDWHQADTFAMASGKPQIIWPETGFGGTVTVWTAFTEASVKTGCLRFQPGTHKKMFYDEMKKMTYDLNRVNKTIKEGIRRGFFGYDYTELLIDPKERPEESKAVSIPMKAGQFVVFWSTLAHASFPNDAEQNVLRLGFASRYVPPYVKIYPDTERIEEYGASLSLDKYGAVLVAGEDNYGYNRLLHTTTRGTSFAAA